MACRSLVHHQRWNRSEAYKDATAIVLGKLDEPNRIQQGFDYKYRFKNIETTWKLKVDALDFILDHSTCSKYMTPFPASQPVIAYFKQDKKGWQLLRIVPFDSDSESTETTIESELQFLKSGTH